MREAGGTGPNSKKLTTTPGAGHVQTTMEVAMNQVGWIFYINDEHDRYVVYVSELDKDAARELIPAHLKNLKVFKTEVMGKGIDDFFKLKRGDVRTGMFQR